MATRYRDSRTTLGTKDKNGNASNTRSTNTKLSSGRPEHKIDESASAGLGLTKQEQQSRDLFGEDHGARAENDSRSTSRHLDESELQSQSLKQLESYAIHRSQDVTQNIRKCMRIVDETTGVATATMEMLHEQGGQITRTHLRTLGVEEELTVGEKLLGSLGGIFSRRWKPKKGQEIKGPQVPPDPYKRRTAHVERGAVMGDGQSHNPERTVYNKKYTGLSGTQVQLEMEKEHQDEALSDLGDMVVKLKHMTREMNEEVEKQTVALGHLEDDVDTVHNRVKQAYIRTRYLVGR